MRVAHRLMAHVGAGRSACEETSSGNEAHSSPQADDPSGFPHIIPRLRTAHLPGIESKWEDAMIHSTHRRTSPASAAALAITLAIGSVSFAPAAHADGESDVIW